MSYHPAPGGQCKVGQRDIGLDERLFNHRSGDPHEVPDHVLRVVASAADTDLGVRDIREGLFNVLDEPATGHGNGFLTDLDVALQRAEVHRDRLFR